MPILLDEFKSDLNAKKVQDILHLIRVAASGGTIDRGGLHHEAM